MIGKKDSDAATWLHGACTAGDRGDRGYSERLTSELNVQRIGMATERGGTRRVRLVRSSVAEDGGAHSGMEVDRAMTAVAGLGSRCC